jgi:hypothetical protein
MQPFWSVLSLKDEAKRIVWMDVESRTIRKRALKVMGSFLLAVLCIVLLNVLTSCEKEDTEVKPEPIAPCYSSDHKNNNFECEDYDSPVCGCNGNTYRNACEAYYVYGISDWTTGSCQTDDSCINPDSITNEACPEYYQPVCSCDGNTYGNECIADAAGVQQYREGVCGSIEFSACSGKMIEIGFDKKDGERFQWYSTVKLECDTCSYLDVYVPNENDSVSFNLSVFKGDNQTPVKVHNFNISGKDCN